MNWLDYLLLALIVSSFVFGLLRGLVREVVALITWVVAVWLAWDYSPLLEPHMGLAPEAMRPWAARGVIFLCVFLLGSLLGALLGHLVRLSMLSGVDHVLGGLFGLMRGVLVVGLFVILCHAVGLEGEPWWRDSRLVPFAEQAANVLRGLVGERKIHFERPHTVALD